MGRPVGGGGPRPIGLQEGETSPRLRLLEPAGKPGWEGASPKGSPRPDWELKKARGQVFPLDQAGASRQSTLNRCPLRQTTVKDKDPSTHSSCRRPQGRPFPSSGGASAHLEPPDVIVANLGPEPMNVQGGRARDVQGRRGWGQGPVLPGGGGIQAVGAHGAGPTLLPGGRFCP